MNEKIMQLTNVNQKENKISMLDLLYGFSFVESVDSAMVNRRVITVIPQIWCKDKIIVEDHVFLEFNELE